MRKQPLEYPNPRTVTHELESFGYRARQLGNTIPRNIQETSDLCSFLSFNLRHCKLIEI